MYIYTLFSCLILYIVSRVGVLSVVDFRVSLTLRNSNACFIFKLNVSPECFESR